MTAIDPPTVSSIWTTMAYDVLSCVLIKITPDSAVMTPAYSGYHVTVARSDGLQARSTQYLHRTTTRGPCP
jgi:hypothetical protein